MCRLSCWFVISFIRSAFFTRPIMMGTMFRPVLSSSLRRVTTWDLSRKPIDMAVGFSHAAVGEAVAHYLLAKGYERFAVITANDERAVLRRDGYVNTLVKAGADRPAVVMTPAPTNVSMGREEIGRLLDAGFRGAVFCSSDALSLGVVTEVKARGLDVPTDIAVIGFGDFEYAANTSPRLSSVMVDRPRIANLSADMLLVRLSGQSSNRRWSTSASASSSANRPDRECRRRSARRFVGATLPQLFGCCSAASAASAMRLSRSRLLVRCMRMAARAASASPRSIASQIASCSRLVRCR